MQRNFASEVPENKKMYSPTLSTRRRHYSRALYRFSDSDRNRIREIVKFESTLQPPKAAARYKGDTYISHFKLLYYLFKAHYSRRSKARLAREHISVPIKIKKDSNLPLKREISVIIRSNYQSLICTKLFIYLCTLRIYYVYITLATQILSHIAYI